MDELSRIQQRHSEESAVLNESPININQPADNTSLEVQTQISDQSKIEGFKQSLNKVINGAPPINHILSSHRHLLIQKNFETFGDDQENTGSAVQTQRLNHNEDQSRQPSSRKDLQTDQS